MVCTYMVPWFPGTPLPCQQPHHEQLGRQRAEGKESLWRDSGEWRWEFAVLERRYTVLRSPRTRCTCPKGSIYFTLGSVGYPVQPPDCAPQILCHLCRCLWNPCRLQVTLGAYINLTDVLLWSCWLNAQLSCTILVLSEVYEGICGVRGLMASWTPVFFWSSSWGMGRILWRILGKTWDNSLCAPELSPKHP